METDFITEVMEKLKNQADIRDKVYEELIKTLFDDKKLLMISRLSDEKATGIIRGLIVSDFFQDTYSKINLKIKVEKINKYPFYKKKYDLGISKEKFHKELLTKLPNLIKNMMMITISYKGEGRKEAFGFLRKNEEEHSRIGNVSQWLRRPI